MHIFILQYVSRNEISKCHVLNQSASDKKWNIDLLGWCFLYFVEFINACHKLWTVFQFTIKLGSSGSSSGILFLLGSAALQSQPVPLKPTCWFEHQFSVDRANGCVAFLLRYFAGIYIYLIVSISVWVPVIEAWSCWENERSELDRRVRLWALFALTWCMEKKLYYFFPPAAKWLSDSVRGFHCSVSF